ncbi:hypothetical protein HK100_012879 [Physocladia obscura]|uniref:Uncharacterized protein n=1 Tax=Physocladia obscura TaxID=109957 RepID=A0AAD5XJY7_9FUNG|nr:hypothetical protein HK100_012879 [Physocladia obscura]
MAPSQSHLIFIVVNQNDTKPGIAALKMAMYPHVALYCVVTANQSKWLTFNSDILNDAKIITTTTELRLRARFANTANFVAAWESTTHSNDNDDGSGRVAIFAKPIIAQSVELATAINTANDDAFELRSIDGSQGLVISDNDDRENLRLSLNGTPPFAIFRLVSEK